MKRIGAVVRAVAPVVFVVATVVLGSAETGMASNPPDRSARVVAKVGNSTITIGELERRMNALSALQIRTYGDTPDEIKRSFLEKVLVPEVLFAQGAMDRRLHEDPAIRSQQRDRLKKELLVRLRDETMEGSKVSPEAIAAFYSDNYDRYHSPALVSVWRILVADRELAASIITQAGRAPSTGVWHGLSRGHSLDKTTALSGGNLGFVTETGLSSDGKTQIPADVAKAAMGVRDGEIVGQPVPEGDGFAVVWRRGSSPGRARTLAEEADTIERTLQEERIREVQESLMERLHKEHVRLLVPNGTEMVAVMSGGELGQPNKPNRVVRRPGKPNPLPTPRGSR